VKLFDHLPAAILNPNPLSFERLQQDYGYVLYRHTIKQGKSGWLKIKQLRDYGIIFINGKKLGILDRRLNQDSIYIDMPTGKVTLDILVENLGRINFGAYLLQNNKGITESVTLNQINLLGWQMFKLPFNNMNVYPIKGNQLVANEPIIKKGIFTLSNTGDTYLNMESWGKGALWVNGHSLGRYWSIGPQQTLFLPAEWLKKGKNEIILVELLKPEQTALEGLAYPILNKVK
jgi:beta-galactosidase